jgi:hypothetical protein
MILSSEIEKIISAWLSGDSEKAISLTELYRKNHQKKCLKCGKVLAKQAKYPYCTVHREYNPIRLKSRKK